MVQSGVVLPEHLDVFDKGIARMLFGGKIELGAVHTYLELFARYFVDLTPNVALIAAVSADKTAISTLVPTPRTRRRS